MQIRWCSTPRWIVLIAMLLLLVAAVACEGDDDTPAAAPPEQAMEGKEPTAAPAPTEAASAIERDAGYISAPESNPQYGGVLKWAGIASTTMYDMHQSGSVTNIGPQSPMYDQLVRLNPVTWEGIIPALATEWTISDDGKTYTFSIREGVKFHNGVPLTAEDVVASFNHIIFPPEGVLSPRKGFFGTVTEVVATDPMTAEFRLSEPRGFTLRAIAAGHNVIVSKQDLEAHDYDLRRVHDYPGTGPFRLRSLEPKIAWKLEKNPDYWNPDLPYADEFHAFHLGTGGPNAAACIAGIADFCWGIGTDGAAKVKELDGVNTAKLVPNSPLALFFNQEGTHQDQPLADARVRKAIHLVVDKPALRQALAEEVAGQIELGWLLHGDALFDDYWATAKDQPGWRSPTVEDRAEAKRLMEEAGYGDGIKDLDFLVRDYALFQAASTKIQGILKQELGIESNYRLVQAGVFYEELGRGAYDVAFIGYGATIPHVADYWSNYYLTDGGNNYTGYSNAEMDSLLAAIAREDDPEEFKRLVNEGIAILDEDVPYSMITTDVIDIAWLDELKGHQMDTRGGNWWSGEQKSTWWLDR